MEWIEEDGRVLAGMARRALTMETAIAGGRLACCAEGLAESLYGALLRHHPDGVRLALALGGPGAEQRALAYLACVGFPVRRPAERPDDRRRTPPEVRALWNCCREAVAFVAEPIGLEPHETARVTLSLSWSLHELLARKPWSTYRALASRRPRTTPAGGLPRP